jgi:hypothetical protein
MGLSGALRLARRELCNRLQELDPGTHFQVIAYNRTAETCRIDGQSGLLLATPGNTRQAVLLLDSLRAEGGTDHLGALKRALMLHPDVVFFLSDADDLTDAQVRSATLFNRGQATIHTVAFVTSQQSADQSPLRALAHANGGQFRAVNVLHNPGFAARGR